MMKPPNSWIQTRSGPGDRAPSRCHGSLVDLLNAALRWGESRANPNRRTRQQRRMPTVAVCSQYSSATSGGLTATMVFPVNRPPPPAEPNRKGIRTAQPSNREQRGLQLTLGPEPAVYGSDAPALNAQNPAESREFLDLNSDVSGESLPTQTQWRRGRDSNPR